MWLPAHPLPFHFRMAWMPLWVGLMLYAVGAALQRLYDLPIIEVTLAVVALAMLLQQSFQDHAVPKPALHGLFLLVIFGLACALTSYLNGDKPQETLFAFIKNATLFVLPVVFLTLRRSDKLLALFWGLLIGNNLYAIGMAGLVLTGSMDALQLKFIMVPPLVNLVTLLTCWNFMPRGLRLLFVSFLVVSFGFCFLALARANILGILLGPFAAAFCGYFWRWRFLRQGMVWLVMLAPIAMGYWLWETKFEDQLYITRGLLELERETYRDDTLLTPSNMERSYMMKASLALIAESPWTGVGSPRQFADAFSENYEWYSLSQAVALSAHNALLEVFVNYGIPVGLAFCMILAVFFFYSDRSGRAGSRFYYFVMALTLYALAHQVTLASLSSNGRLYFIYFLLLLLMLRQSHTAEKLA